MLLTEYIRVEQAKAVYSNLWIVLWGTVTVSLITASVLWFSHPAAEVMSWLLVSLLITGLRWWTLRGIAAETDLVDRAPRWLKFYIFWAFVTGLHWGLVSLFFYSKELPVETLLITCLYAGYMSGSMTTHSMYFQGFLGFAIPSTGLFAMSNLMEGGEVYLSIFVMTVLYSIALYSIARNSSKLFSESKTAIYENMQLTEQLTLQKESAENAVLAKNRFLAAASHDLRQPLHALSLFVDALKPYLKEGEGKEIREKISQSTEALNGLLHSLLDISKLDASVIKNSPENISIHRLIHPLEEEYRSLAKVRGIELRVEWQGTHTAFVDPILIERVLRNLLDNAVKYSDDGVISISCHSDEDHIILTVADEGIGIPANQQIKVFTEFGQLENSGSDRPKGLGLGLAIVIRLCELMGIKLQMDSREGEGTTMTLWLEKGDEGLVRIVEQGQFNPGQKFSIVAIDDDPDILQAMQHVFSEWNCELVTAFSVKDALNQMVKNNFEPNVILADFSLRNNESGLDAIAIIRDEFNECIPAILVTGDTAPHRVKMATDSDVTVMYKPLRSEELRLAVSGLLEERSNHRG
ncbi:MAG: hybrid sensor histidine kinase/response regulator [Acidiferrobacterales bacterium]|nr:hybrid sensor histidine kinase/response regulator [Acidiferrobacterales bacterium]